MITTRKVTRQECPWLPADIEAGTAVRVTSCPYANWACRSGVMVMVGDRLPYLEVPADASGTARMTCTILSESESG